MVRLYLILGFLFVWTSATLSQAGEWTWVHGDSVTKAPPSFGVQGTASVNNSPGARAAGASWTDLAGNFWLFGGTTFFRTGVGSANDLWKYEVAINKWTWVNGDSIANKPGVYGSKGFAASTNIPGARLSEVYWTDSDGNFWLFGGQGYDGSGFQCYLNDLWKFDLSLNQWIWMNGDSVSGGLLSVPGVYGTKGSPSLQNKPSGRIDCSGDIDKSGNLWLFGGIGSTTNKLNVSRLNDLWKYNIASNIWTWVSGDSILDASGVYGVKGIFSPDNKPWCRYASKLWADSLNLWLFGGVGYLSAGTSSQFYFLNDLWKFSLLTNQWVWISGDSLGIHPGIYGTKNVPSITNNPGGRFSYMKWLDSDGALLLFGGTGYAATDFGKLNDMWRYDTTSNTWTWLNGDSSIENEGSYGTVGVPSISNKPGGRQMGLDWIDTSFNLWIFGGLGHGATTYGRLNDLWKYSVGGVTPLHLINFTGKLRENSTQLLWTVDNEQNFSHYEVQRSTNSREFYKIESVQSKGENKKNAYSYIDPLDEKITTMKLYYRLKMVDKDASFTYSNIVNIKLNNQSSFTIYPNPAKTSVQLQFNETVQSGTVIEVADMSGKVVLRSISKADSRTINLSVSKLLPGSYVVAVRGVEGDYLRKVLIVK